MSKKKVRVIIVVLCFVILAVVCAYLIATHDDSTYDKYTDVVVDHTSDNKLIGKEDLIVNEIKSLQNELSEYGVTEYDAYTISYSADTTLVTIIYQLTDNTVYVSLRFNDDLSEVIDYTISDDNSEGDAEDVD